VLLSIFDEMNIKPLLLSIWLLFSFSGCLLSIPDGSRINENDPDSPLFHPKLSNLDANVSSLEKQITLNWKDESLFNDGFYIEKKFSKNDSYKKVNTIETSFFSETTTEYSIDLQYRVTSFYLEDGLYKKGMDLETDKLDFGSLTNIGYFSNNDTVFVQWFRKTAFDDVITIEYKPTSNSVWNTALTITQDEITTDFFRTNFLLPIGKSYNLRIIASLLNHSGYLEPFYVSPTYTVSLD
tara:strand:+ start:6258 stop:6974 length:717 start_codon:yes stop_codon:yes gene_type:complete